MNDSEPASLELAESLYAYGFLRFTCVAGPVLCLLGIGPWLVEGLASYDMALVTPAPTILRDFYMISSSFPLTLGGTVLGLFFFKNICYWSGSRVMPITKSAACCSMSLEEVIDSEMLCTKEFVEEDISSSLLFSSISSISVSPRLNYS